MSHRVICICNLSCVWRNVYRGFLGRINVGNTFYGICRRYDAVVGRKGRLDIGIAVSFGSSALYTAVLLTKA